MISISEAQDEDAAAWDEFVDSQPGGTFFHLFAWRKIIASVFGHKPHYLMARAGQEVRGVLPLVEQHSWLFGRVMCSTPFCMYGGPISADDSARDRLLEHATALTHRTKSDYLEIRCIGDLGQGWPRKDLYVRFRKEISDNHEQNLLGIPRKQRAVVRKAQAAGLRAEFTSDVDKFFYCYSTSVRNLGTPVFSKRYFEQLMKQFGDACDILLIQNEERPVASVMSFYYRDEVLPMYGGGTFEARSVGANDFMYWELMRAAADRGIRWFDFGRSRVGSGSFRFKKYWGFEPEPLAYQYSMPADRPLPNLSPDNPKVHRLIAVWKRLPLRVSQLIGPMVSRHLG